MFSSRSMLALAFAGACMGSHAQTVPALDHVIVNDGRVFDLSDSGSGYRLDDGPEATATLSVVQGPKGKLAGSVVFQDTALNPFGPVPVSGKLKVSGTGPLAVTLKGSGPAKVQVTGTYDPGVKFMNVRVTARTPDKRTFSWNDSFVPDGATTTGIHYDRLAVTKNRKLTVSGTHWVEGPGIAGAIKTSDQELSNSGFSLKGKGLTLLGSYNTATTSFTVTSSLVDTGYGRIVTPGSLVTVTSDNTIVREP